MTGKARDPRQFTLLDGDEEPLPAQPEVVRRPKGRTKAIETPRTAPPSHRAPRGDLFREYAEKQWASPGHTQPTPEDLRHKAYRNLAESVGHSIYRRKKSLRGPIEKLRKFVGSNRYGEFAQWLNRIGEIKGASVTVRYYALLSLIEKRIEDVAIEYRYTHDDFDNVSLYESAKQDLDTARGLVHKARGDTAELKPLLSEVAHLYARLGHAKRMAASPPPRMSADTVRAWLAEEAQKERNRRVAASRRWLRDLMEPDKRRDDDVRCGAGWINLASLTEVLGDDLSGYAGMKPLWPSLPAAAELARDYQISQRDARRLLTAYAGGTLSNAGAAPQEPAPAEPVPSAPGDGDEEGAAAGLGSSGHELQSAQGTGPHAEIAAPLIRRRRQPRRP